MTVKVEGHLQTNERKNYFNTNYIMKEISATCARHNTITWSVDGYVSIDTDFSDSVSMSLKSMSLIANAKVWWCVRLIHSCVRFDVVYIFIWLYYVIEVLSHFNLQRSMSSAHLLCTAHRRLFVAVVFLSGG